MAKKVSSSGKKSNREKTKKDLKKDGKATVTISRCKVCKLDAEAQITINSQLVRLVPRKHIISFVKQHYGISVSHPGLHRHAYDHIPSFYKKVKKEFTKNDTTEYQQFEARETLNMIIQRGAHLLADGDLALKTADVLKAIQLELGETINVNSGLNIAGLDKVIKILQHILAPDQYEQFVTAMRLIFNGGSGKINNLVIENGSIIEGDLAIEGRALDEF